MGTWLSASLNSFLVGFCVGCTVFYLLHCANSFDICLDCGTLPPSPPTLAASSAFSSLSSLQAETALPPSSPPATRRREKSRRLPAGAPEPATPAGPPEPGCPDRPLGLVILVLSTPGGNLRRNAIRGSWLHHSPRGKIQLTVRFVIGAGDLPEELAGNLTAENTMFKDILLLPAHREAYSNLTVKVLAALVWADHSLDFDYLVKADDDSYIRIPQLERALRQFDCPSRLYWGYFTGHAVPERMGKWRELHWTQCPHYLPYAMGGGYVLSRKLVRLLSRYQSRLQVYHNEDVSLGSWLAPFRVTRRHDLRFNTESQSHGCNNNYIISHKEKVRSMYHKYVRLKKNKTFCEEEEKEIRPSFIYNWSASSPVDCCERVKGIPVPMDDDL